jgi:hypothetical protein
VAPRDPTLFSIAAFAFAEDNQDAAQSLLARSRSDGGGDASYSLSPNGGPRARGWMDVTGSVLDPAAFRSTSAGIEGGADVDLSGGLRIGGALAYEDAHLTDSASGWANQDYGRVSLYASQTVGAVGLSASLSYAHADESLSRAPGFGRATSSRGVDDVSGAFEASAPIQTGGTWVTPSVGVLVSDLSAGAFAETDGASSAFALRGLAASNVAVSPYATVGVSHVFVTQAGGELTPDVQVGYRYDGLASGLSQTLVAADGTPFVGNRADLGRSSALLGASLSFHQANWSVYVKYRATVAGDWNNQSFDLGLRYAF